MPTAMLLSPSGTTLFIANSATNNISTYTVKTDGTLTAGSSSATAGTTPLSMAIDSASHFLFVANQGSQIDPASVNVSVFILPSGCVTEVAALSFFLVELLLGHSLPVFAVIS